MGPMGFCGGLELMGSAQLSCADGAVEGGAPVTLDGVAIASIKLEMSRDIASGSSCPLLRLDDAAAVVLVDAPTALAPLDTSELMNGILMCDAHDLSLYLEQLRHFIVSLNFRMDGNRL